MLRLGVSELICSIPRCVCVCTLVCFVHISYFLPAGLAPHILWHGLHCVVLSVTGGKCFELVLMSVD